jgi:hypothetical protein
MDSAMAAPFRTSSCDVFQANLQARAFADKALVRLWRFNVRIVT